jgi:undecaprenyl-diphosphatase
MGKFSNFSFWVPFYCAVLLLMLAYDKVRFLKYLAFACIYLVVAIGCLLIFNFYFGHTTPLYDQSLLSVLKTGANGKGAPYGCLPLASVAAGFALMLTLYFRRNYLYLKIAITVWAFLVLFSRVYNTWNYPKEIAAGITLTLVLAYLAYKTYRCYLKRYAHAG